ncbi:MAG: glycosyltransferase family 4 protein [Candidatus Pacebacteria bacterium]|nr:glycosyltransferase family 4 protein [Candidatus Paceibacterota bacterium]
MDYRKKILVTTSTFPNFLKNDSTPPFVYELSKRLSKKYDLKIIVSTPYIRNSKELEEKDNMKIYRYKYGFSALRDGAMLPNIKKNKFLILQIPFLLLFSFLNIIKIVKKEHISIIHAHWIFPQCFLAVFYKKLFRKKNLKIICTIHGSDIFELKNRFFVKIKKWTLNNSEVITVVSKEIKNEVYKIGIKKTPTILAPMGVDELFFNPDKCDINIRKKYGINSPLFLFVGRLVEKKGLKYTFLAMKLVLKKYPDAKLLIAGVGPQKNELKNLSKNLGIEKNIIFLGGISNQELPSYYTTADLFLSSTLSEGFGLVFVEAMLCKCPVISSDLKAISDVVKNGKTGIQVDVKNTQLYTDKILELMKNNRKRKQLVENGYKFAKENFIWDISVEKYYNLIKNL